MSIDVIKNYSTYKAWNEITNIVPDTKQYLEKTSLGKKQSLDFGIKCMKLASEMPSKAKSRLLAEIFSKIKQKRENICIQM